MEDARTKPPPPSSAVGSGREEAGGFCSPTARTREAEVGAWTAFRLKDIFRRLQPAPFARLLGGGTARFGCRDEFESPSGFGAAGAERSRLFGLLAR